MSAELHVLEAPIEAPATQQDVLDFMDLLKRFSALRGELADAVGVDLDAMLTTEQCSKWLQLEPKALNRKARTGLIPCVPMSDHTFRFHPRTILERGHAIYTPKKKK